jgi:hypothetical protein
VALKTFWRILANGDCDRTWFPHADGRHMCRWNLQRQEYEFRPMSPEEQQERDRANIFFMKGVAAHGRRHPRLAPRVRRFQD